MSEQLTEQQQSEWVRTQFQKANEYLGSKGILPDQVLVKESRYLVPLVAIWRIKSQDRKEYWVLTGDLPSDHMPFSAATSPKEAIRAFSLHWQLKAQQILDTQQGDKTQLDFANLLIGRAQSLYELFNNEAMWQSSQSS
ncbi:DUF4826 family protein [Alkalimonas delamerensis]|uniref:DUF4826 family protein n=1 Tax=Alkalimonas delamerensis TaxID=265981 RepID=A0ABT9GN41_9GAMM|nr:DUF4826 family protein [Alkalimonas delamerensis]MDP4528397.1 DUF4826 family protein [Alkalimonas delamerensis]